MTLPETNEMAETIYRPPGPTEEQELLSGIAKTVFRLNGQALAIAEDLAGPAGLTAAWWQVLANVLGEPLSVADISRSIGNTRQSVQRVADRLVHQGLAEYQPNPAHRRAKLLASTEQGRLAVRANAPAHAELARRLSDEYGKKELSQLLASLTNLSAALETISRSEATWT